jgi:hypothetical protein
MCDRAARRRSPKVGNLDTMTAPKNDVARYGSTAMSHADVATGQHGLEIWADAASWTGSELQPVTNSNYEWLADNAPS